MRAIFNSFKTRAFHFTMLLINNAKHRSSRNNIIILESQPNKVDAYPDWWFCFVKSLKPFQHLSNSIKTQHQAELKVVWMALSWNIILKSWMLSFHAVSKHLEGNRRTMFTATATKRLQTLNKYRRKWTIQMQQILGDVRPGVPEVKKCLHW